MTSPTPPIDPAPPTLAGLFRRATLRALAVVALIALAVVAYAAWWRRGHSPSHARADEVAWCEARYAAARSAAESSAVSSLHVPNPGGGASAERLCRELRVGG
jgi:hypothetical protein